MTATGTYATITSRLGVHVATTGHTSRRAAEQTARQAIRSGSADSAAVVTGTETLRYFGLGY